MTLTEAEIATLCRLARAAGAAIMPFYNPSVQVQEKADSSPLTEADLAADRVIRRGLEAAFPSFYVLSEESETSAAACAEGPFFLVDPLDGTKEFLKRNGEFTVNIALVDGAVQAGFVYAPVLDRLYFGVRGEGAFVQQGLAAPRPIHVAAPGEGPLRVVGSRSHGGEETRQWLETLQRPYTLVCAGSSLKFCMVAEGAADLYPRFGPTGQWDTAAAQGVLECAGGTVLDLTGRPLTYCRERSQRNPDFVAWGVPPIKALAE